MPSYKSVSVTEPSSESSSVHVQSIGSEKQAVEVKTVIINSDTKRAMIGYIILCWYPSSNCFELVASKPAHERHGRLQIHYTV